MYAHSWLDKQTPLTTAATYTSKKHKDLYRGKGIMVERGNVPVLKNEATTTIIEIIELHF